MNIIEAIQDPRFFRTNFKDIGSWRSWFVLLKALFGLRFESDEERQIFSAGTGLTSPPNRQVKESYIIADQSSSPGFWFARWSMSTTLRNRDEFHIFRMGGTFGFAQRI